MLCNKQPPQARTPSRVLASPCGFNPSSNALTSTPIGWQEREAHYKQQTLQQEVQLVQLTQIAAEREKVTIIGI